MASFSNYKATIIAASEEASGVSGGGGTTTFYDSIDLLPYIGNTNGDQAYVSSNNRLYLWDSIGWYNIALINRAPGILSVQDSDGNTTPFALSTEGATTNITILATDSDGDPITYSATGDSNLARIGSISQNGNEFTITPFSEDSATAESATIIFKATDGVNISSSSVNTFTLTFQTPEWAASLSSTSYDTVQYTILDTTPTDIHFKPDGTKMYIAFNGSNEIAEHDLSTAWDMSTASETQTVDVSSQTTAPTGVHIGSNGNKMYVNSGTGYVYQYSLSTAYDLSTASYDSVSLDHTTQTSDPRAMTMSYDGTKVYVMDNGSPDSVYQYNLSTRWDLSSASYSGNSLNVSGQQSIALGVTFNNRGTQLYISGINPDAVHRYTLSTAWDISTAVYASDTLDITSQGSGAGGLAFKIDDGAKMYTVGFSQDAVYQYSTGL